MAFVVARGAVDACEATGAGVLVVGAFLAGLAIVLLFLLLAFERDLEVGVHVDDVFSVVVVAPGARAVGAKTEYHESLGFEDGVDAILVVVVVVVALLAGVLFDGLTPVEFDGVARDVDLTVFFFELTNGGGAVHELSYVLGIRGVLRDFRGKGVGGGRRGHEEGADGGNDLHCSLLLGLVSTPLSYRSLDFHAEYLAENYDPCRDCFAMSAHTPRIVSCSLRASIHTSGHRRKTDSLHRR